MSVRVSDFLREEVYPRIDAHDAGLLDNLNPQVGRGDKMYYVMRCPRCDHPKKAFYYPGHERIVCNRRNNCQPTSLFDYVKDTQRLDNGGTFRFLCDIAGVEPPNKQSSGQTAPSSGYRLKQELQAILKEALHAHPRAMNYLLKERKFTKEDIDTVSFGYYPSHNYIEEKLKERNLDLETAKRLQVLPDDEFLASKKTWMMNDRLCGIWRNPHGEFSLWGRKIDDDAFGPKYLFSQGMVKDMPYGWTGSAVSFPWGVEGTLDSESLRLMGVNGLAFGGNTVNSNQAKFLAEAGVRDIGFITDGDKAGIKGAIDAIKRCEMLGMTFYVVVIPEGFDDVDNMRKQGMTHEFHHLIQNAMTGGEFAARMFVTWMEKRPNKKGQLMRQATAMRHLLTPASRASFDQIFLMYGYDMNQNDLTAQQLYLRLLDESVEAQAAQKIVQDVYDVTITVEMTPCKVE